MATNADGEIRIATTLDTGELQKQIDQLKNTMDKTGKDIEKKSNVFKKVGEFIKSGGLAAAVGGSAAATAIKKTVDALNDCAEAYRVQELAEKNLEIAARNNPYLLEENVYNLRAFASELQKTSEIGDETSLNIMAQLAATGRTESEIIRIMSAAADMAAATGENIESVAHTLNATYSGTSGTLGRQIAEIKNLTEAELEAGRAVEIVAEKYKGSASELATVEVQLQNAWGDFKESIGAGWQAQTKPVKEFFLDLLNTINQTIPKAQELEKALKMGATTNTKTDYTTVTSKIELEQRKQEYQSAIDTLNEQIEAEKNKLNDKKALGTSARIMGISTAGVAKIDEEFIKQAEEKIKINQAELDNINKQLDKLKTENNNVIVNTTPITATTEPIDEYAIKIRHALKQKLKQLDIEAFITGQDFLEQKIAATADAYVKLMAGGEFDSQMDPNYPAPATTLKELQYLQSLLDLKKEQERLDAEDAAEKERQQKKIKEQALQYIRDEKQERENLIKEIDKNELLSFKEKQDAKAAIDREIKAEEDAAEAEALKAKKEALQERLEMDRDYAQTMIDIISNMANMVSAIQKKANEKQLADLENRYEKGEYSEEEYYEKHKELTKQAAENEYRLRLWEWTASMLTATANNAVAVTKAYAEGNAFGAILMGIAGATQLAAIIASKPQAPSFYTGGVVGGMNGATAGGDNTYIHARTGEMILNAGTQRRLWNMLTGTQTAGGKGLTVTVNNTQSDRVDTQIRRENNQLIVEIIDSHINQGLKDGTYDKGYYAMQARNTGVTIL